MKKEKNLYFSYRSFWPQLETIKELRKENVKTICFISGNTVNALGEPYCKYPPVWVWYDQYAFENLDRQIEDILSAVPDAELICKVDLNTPIWWTRWSKWQSELQSAYDSYYGLGQLALWDKWREDTGNYLEAFLSHCRKKYGDRIKAYVFGCGAAGEWVDRSLGEESPYRYEAYKQWMKEHGLEAPADIPGRSVRLQCSHELLRDPEKDHVSLNYWRFTAWQVADTIEYFAKKARGVLGDTAEIGFFYGYIWELYGSRLVHEGHLDFEKVCQCKEIDFLVAPATYSDRKMGGGSGFMASVETLRRYGKRFLQECDQRTHTTNFQLSKYVRMNFSHWEDVHATIAGLKREISLCLINKASLWLFDMWGGFYTDPKVVEAIGQLKSVWDAWKDYETEVTGEVLLVFDPENAYYMKGGRPGDGGLDEREFNVGIRNKLNRLGAPFRICSFADIAHLKGIDSIKFVILATPFELDCEKMDVLKSKLMNRNRTILFFHAPGIIKDGKWNETNVKTISGFDYKTPGLNVAQREDWKSAYIYDPGELELSQLVQLSREAGVHFYCSQAVPVFANNRFLAVHCGEAHSSMEVLFPCKYAKITELFSGKEFLTTDRVQLTSEHPKTYLFCTEKE